MLEIKNMERSSLNTRKKVMLKCFNRNASISLEIGLNIVSDNVVHRFMNMEGKGCRFDP
jgi:hypothetical protein